jgi:hypothetical protein
MRLKCKAKVGWFSGYSGDNSHAGANQYTFSPFESHIAQLLE